MAEASSQGTAESTVEKYETPPPLLEKQKSLSSCDCSGGCDSCAPPVQAEDEVLQEQVEEEYDSGKIYSSDSDGEYAPPGQKFDRELWIRYKKQIFESDGFDVVDYPGPCVMTWIAPRKRFKEVPSLVKLMDKLAGIAIQQFNLENDEKYQVVDVEKVNSELVAGYIYYITFQARKVDADVKDESALKTFQARVWDPIPPEEVEVIFCRLKPLITSNH